MSKTENENEKNWKYSGDEHEWDSFDRRMIRYMRKKYDSLGEKLWLGTIDVVSDDMDPHDFMEHCDEVLKAIGVMDASEARRIKKDRDEFDDPEWQYNWMKQQLSLMVDYIESHSKGQAEIEIINYEGAHIDIRKHLYKQFGAGSGGNIHERELDFDRGMPDKGKVAFPKGCDMSEKLRQLESRRLYFMRMAGTPEKRRTYTYCQETKLVRIVLEHVNKEEYGDCIKRVLDSVKLRKMMERVVNGEDMDEVGIPDNHKRSFSDDWLPSWTMLKASLLEEWAMRCNDYGKQKEKGKGVLPVAMGGVKEVSCYGCGIAGHKKGDPGCKAGKFDAHSNAPKDYKERMAKKRKTNYEVGGKQGGKQPGKPGKKGGDKGEKRPCRAFNFGKGTCRYGAKYHFLHDKQQGDGKAPEFSPLQEKMVNAMVASAIKKTAKHIAKKAKVQKAKAKKSKEDEGSGEDSDYASMLAACMLAPIKNTIRRDYKASRNDTVTVADLHSVEKNCGIDSDAGISISTLPEDFLWIDDSAEAK
jgi:hypothetical protein